MNRVRVLAVATLVMLLAACGNGVDGDQPDTTAPGTTVVADPRDYVRAQMDSTVEAYVASIAQQMPSVTSMVDQPGLTTCVKERINQVIDAAQPQPGQPDADFASALLEQAQGSLYGFVGMCAGLSG